MPKLLPKNKRTRAYNSAVYWLHTLARESNDIVPLGLAYSEVAKKHYEQWYRNEYSVSLSNGLICIQRLKGGCCNPIVAHDCQPPGFAHGKLWLRDGVPYSITYHPRKLELADLTELAALCQRNELDVHIGYGSWESPAFRIVVELKWKGRQAQ